jgi:hypothetical protein
METSAVSAVPSFVRVGLFPTSQTFVPSSKSNDEAPAPIPSLTRPAERPRRVAFEDLSRQEQEALVEYVEGPEASSRRWSETDRLVLHLVLLAELRKLRYPKTPLDEVIDLVQWVLSDRENEPFSFARCIQVAKLYPHLWPDEAFEGLLGLEVEAARQAIVNLARPVLRQKFRNYPEWVVRALRTHLGYVSEQLDEDPQWLNTAIRIKDTVDARLRSEACPAWLKAYVQTHPEVVDDPCAADLAWLGRQIGIREQISQALARPDLSPWLRDRLLAREPEAVAQMERNSQWLIRQMELNRQIDEAAASVACPLWLPTLIAAGREAVITKLQAEPLWLARSAVQVSLF